MKYPTSLKLIRDAADWWKKNGFLEKTVPALVDPDVMKHTCPPGVHDDRLYGAGTDTVVASAEQSFLQLDKDGEIRPGDWMALTPCYRDEPILDEVHLPVFLKLELIRLSDEENFYTRSNAMWLAGKMQRFFSEFYGMPTELVETMDGFDVVYDDLELGSFGVRRTMTGKSYVYGTGLAEPRASIALMRFQQKCESTFD
ncbi:seryl-tRNA synthetase [Pectobacterium phage PcCB7V]|nr:seryl-tRNA synthetase [Pectobacterium phage PcCB7V]